MHAIGNRQSTCKACISNARESKKQNILCASGGSERFWAKFVYWAELQLVSPSGDGLLIYNARDIYPSQNKRVPQCYET